MTRTYRELDDPMRSEPRRAVRARVSREEGAEREQSQEANHAQYCVPDDVFLEGQERNDEAGHGENAERGDTRGLGVFPLRAPVIQSFSSVSRWACQAGEPGTYREGAERSHCGHVYNATQFQWWDTETSKVAGLFCCRGSRSTLFHTNLR